MGSLDVPSTQEGLLVARQLGRTMKQKEFTKCYSSPLLRARQSAEAIFPSSQITFNADLSERDLGHWQGKTKDAIHKEYPAAFYQSGTMNPFFTPPGGETLEDVVSRVTRFLTQISELGDGEHIIAVSHNGIIRILRCLLEFRSLEEIFIESEPYLEPRTYLSLPSLSSLQAFANLPRLV